MSTSVNAFAIVGIKFERHELYTTQKAIGAAWPLG